MASTTDMLMRRAARHHLAGELREAASLYRKLLQDNPQHAGALHALGVMAQQTGRSEAAEKLLLRAVATDPSLAAAHDDLGALWLLQGKTAQAAAAFGEATRVDPKYAKAYAHLGAALSTLGRHDEAAAAYQRAVDSAMTAVRRFKNVGIDISTVTEPLLSAPAALPRVRARAGQLAPDENHYARLDAESEEDDRDGPQDSPETVMTLVDDEEDEGVVGLTLVSRPEAGAMSPLRARAEEIGFAYASMAGAPLAPSTYPWAAEETPFDPPLVSDDLPLWPPGGYLPAGEDVAPAMTVSMLDPEAWQSWCSNGDAESTVYALIEDEPVFVVADEPAWPAHLSADDEAAMAIHFDSTSLQEPAQDIPMIVAEVGDPRFDAPHAMFGGGMMANPLVATDRSPMSTANSPRHTLSGGSNGHAPDDAAIPVAPQTHVDESPAPIALAQPPEAANRPADDLSPVTPVSVSISTRDVTEGASTLPFDVIGVVPVTGTPLLVPDAGPNDAEPFVELADEGESTGDLVSETDAEDDVAEAVDEAELEKVDVVDDSPGAGEMAMPPKAQRVSLPPSASRLTDDPVLAPRMLAKEIRRARRKPSAGAKQAAELHKQGTTHLRQRRVDEAIAALERLVELQPASAKAHRDLGAAYIRGDRFDDAIASLQRALELRPRFADAYASLGDVYHLQGRVEEAITCYRQTLALRPSASTAHSNLLLNLNYQRKNDAQTLYAEHLKWAKVHAAPLMREILPHDNSPTASRQIRIGYVSGDFRRHAVGSFIEPILANREPEGFHVICYSDVLRPDDATERISAMCDGWRDIRGLSDAEVAEMIREDKIDILVDLAGHTGTNRLCVFARKPAPVQVTYLGYPNTTGLGTMDYRITDTWADPLGQSEPFHTEQLYRLPKGFLCYQGPTDAPPPVPPPVAKNGFVTFGCYNILAKLTPETLGLWAKIMTVLPNSRIVLKDRLGTLANPARRRHVQDIFAYHRIAADRLELLGKEPDRQKHLESYSKVDIMLDPFPYNGTTTTCEALWMGVPVITLTGNRHASRVGVSILKSAGLPEFIATNIEGYARSAVLLARDVNRLTLLRRTLRQKIAASTLCDAPKFTKTLGMAYREMWTYWCQTRGQPMLPALRTLELEGPEGLTAERQ